MNKNKQVIAILGGMGPQASIKLVELLVEKSVQNGAKDDSDFPEIILDSVPVPNFISDSGNLKQVLKILKERVRMLNRMDISKFAIACNTAHILLEDLQEVSKVPFVSIIKAVVDEIKRKKLRKVGLLATPSTIRFGLFERELSKSNIDLVLPTKNEQIKLEFIIRRVLAGKISKLDELNLILIADSLKRQGARGIILGCTELPLVFPKKFTTPIFNSLDLLANALLIKSKGGNTIHE